MPAAANFLKKTGTASRIATRIRDGYDPANSNPIGHRVNNSLVVRANLALVFILMIGIVTIIEYLFRHQWHLQVTMVGLHNHPNIPHHLPTVPHLAGMINA